MKFTQPLLCGLVVAVLFTATPAPAQEVHPAGRLALRWTVGPTFVVSNSDLRRQSRVGPAISGALLWDAMQRLGLVFSYDRLDAGRTLETETVTGGFRFTFNRDGLLKPFVEAGGGVGKRDAGEGFKKLALRGAVGLSAAISPRFSTGILASYHFLETQGIASGDLHAIVPSVFAAYHFGPN